MGYVADAKMSAKKINNEHELVECPECGDKVPDFTPEAECIGWLGRCAKCEMNDAYRND